MRTSDKVDSVALRIGELLAEVKSLSMANAALGANIVQLQGQMTGVQNRLLRVEAAQDSQRGDNRGSK